MGSVDPQIYQDAGNDGVKSSAIVYEYESYIVSCVFHHDVEFNGDGVVSRAVTPVGKLMRIDWSWKTGVNVL